MKHEAMARFLKETFSLRLPIVAIPLLQEAMVRLLKETFFSLLTDHGYSSTETGGNGKYEA